MRQIVAGLVSLLLAWPALADNKPQDKSKEKKEPIAIPATAVIAGGQDSAQGKNTPAAAPDTPAGKYQVLLKEYSEAQQKFFKEYQEAKTQAEKQKVLQERRPDVNQFAAKFMELAEKNPKDPAALDALLWVVRTSLGSRNAKDSPRSKAIALLVRDHITSPRLGPVCQSLAFAFQDKDAEPLLRQIMEKNPSAEVKGEACLALAQLLAQKASIVKELKDESTANQFEKFFGKDLVADLKKQDAAQLASESDAFFKTFADKYLAQIKPDKLDMLVQRLANVEGKGGELVLRRVVEDTGKDIKPETRGKACMALATMLKQRA
ncbi:MAG TPA: hypothetical protein VFA18_13665, partial [Gemmataceae bacterium]|nr:hypothetical protein [Gemmataceae bacterium]